MESRNEDPSNTSPPVIGMGEETLRDTVNKLLSEKNNHDMDPETLQAALDAVRYEHQRLQDEFMTLASLSEHVELELAALDRDEIKEDLGL